MCKANFELVDPRQRYSELRWSEITSKAFYPSLLCVLPSTGRNSSTTGGSIFLDSAPDIDIILGQFCSTEGPAQSTLVVSL